MGNLIAIIAIVFTAGVTKVKIHCVRYKCKMVGTELCVHHVKVPLFSGLS